MKFIRFAAEPAGATKYSVVFLRQKYPIGEGFVRVSSKICNMFITGTKQLGLVFTALIVADGCSGR